MVEGENAGNGNPTATDKGVEVENDEEQGGGELIIGLAKGKTTNESAFKLQGLHSFRE